MAAVLAVLLWTLVLIGCGGGDEDSFATSGPGGRGPVGTLVFWGGEGHEPVLVDTRSGLMQRGNRNPKWAFHLTPDGWGALFMQEGHYHAYRLFDSGVWEEGGTMATWAENVILSPDSRAVIAVTGVLMYTGQRAVHYGRFDDDGSLIEQAKLSDEMLDPIMGTNGATWSPDSEHWAVALLDGLALYHKTEQIWFLPNSDTTGLTRTAAFSPDGQWLAISVYDKPRLALSHRLIGYQLYNVPGRAFVIPAEADEMGGSYLPTTNDFYGQSGGQLDMPLWAFDSSGLIVNRKRFMLKDSSNSCGNENPVPIEILRIPETFQQDEPVVDSLSVLVPDERLGDYCLRWSYLGAIPEHGSLLYGFEYREKRYFGRASPGVANSSYPIIELYFVEVPLDGTEAREIGSFNNDAPGLGYPFDVHYQPFMEYSLRCRSGRNGAMLFNNGIVLNPETGESELVPELTQGNAVSGDCNCYAEADTGPRITWSIYDFYGERVSGFDMESALEVTHSFTPHDWR